MKTHKILSWLLIAPLAALLYSCSSSDKDDNSQNSPIKVELHSIKMMNAGAEGTEVLEGVVDEEKKLITFPAIDPATDLSAVEFEVELSEGAKLDQATYDFTIPEGDSGIEKIIKVQNEKRTREYIVKLELDIIVYGGNFDKAVVYDHGANATVYPYFTGQSTRSSDFDGEYALIVSRKGGLSPHVLKLEDIKNGNVNNPIMLNTEDITGGIFALSAGKIAQGRIYIANMSGPDIKVYMWETPESKPELIIHVPMLGAGTGRYGDSMDMSLDASGNGFIFFENNATGEIDRLKIKNFKELVDQDIIAPVDKTKYKGGQYFSYSKIENTPYYIYTGYESPLMLVDEEGAPAGVITLQEGTKVPTAINQAKVVEFGGNRYLIGVTASRNANYLPQAVIVFDISKGKDIVEAFEILNETAKEANIVYEYTFGKSDTNSPGTNAGAKVVDDKLYIYGAADNNGFVVIEVPLNEAE